MTLRAKRIHQAASRTDGFRVLVDRLWPRGITHERAALGAWLKDVAPSAELRTWWNHDPARFEEFAERYRAELDANDAVDELQALMVDHSVVTLLYAAHDPKVNHAVVLEAYLDEKQSDAADR